MFEINNLEVCDLAYNPIAWLNDNTLNCASKIITEERLNGIDTLSFEMPKTNPKWIYLLNENLIKWKGQYYFIKNPSFSKSEDGIIKNIVQCKSLSSSLEGKLNPSLELIGVNADTMMEEVLTGTGWTYSIDSQITTQNKLSFLESKEQSAFTNLIAIAEKFEAFLKFDSSTREVKLLKSLPDRKIIIRNNINLKSILVEQPSDDIVTRLFVFGGDNIDTGLEVNIMSVNPTGQDYIENYSFYLNQGYDMEYINQHPELFLKEQVWNATDYKDAQSLYDDAVEKLAKLCKPSFHCKFTGLDLSSFPEFRIKSPIAGEVIYIIDDDLSLNIQAKVIEIKKSDDEPLPLEIEISEEIVYSSVMKQILDSSKKVSRTTLNSGYSRGSKLSGVIDIERAKLESVVSHFYTDDNGNMIFENEQGTNAMKIGAGIFGIASSKDINGNWDWSVFGSGNGFSADHMNTGTLDADLVNVVNLNADNITAGQIDANIIDVVNIKVDKLTASDGSNVLYLSAGSLYFNSILYGFNSDMTKAVAMFPQAGMFKGNVVQAWGDNTSYSSPDGILALGKIQQLSVNTNALIGNGGDGSGAIVVGYLTVTGSKNSLQSTKNYGDRLINAYETADYYFGDIGSGIIGTDGECIIAIDEVFQECINMDIQYHVFTQVYNGKINIIDRQVGYFIVRGEVGTKFSWELKAKRKGYEHNRMELQNIQQDYIESNIETELNYAQVLEENLLGG